MSIQEEIQALIGDAKLEDAINKFKAWAKGRDSDLENAIILLQARYNALKRNANLNLLEPNDIARESNRIINALLELLRGVKSDGDSSTPPPSVNQHSIPNPETVIEPKKTILFFASNPLDTGQLQLEKEFAGISASLQEKQAIFNVFSKWATRANEVQSEIVKRKPQIIHFSGHGVGALVDNSRAVGRPSQIESGLIFQDARGRSQVMDTGDLKRMFELFAKYNMKVNTVVLNACYSAEQAKAIMPHVDYVVGMTTAVGDEAAIVFAKEFYAILAETGNVEMAFDFGVSAINIDNLPDGDTPKLYPRDV